MISFSSPIKPLVITQGYWENHRAIDCKTKMPPTPQGQRPVYACADGVVEMVKEGKIEGKYITIKHAQGFKSYVGHLSEQWVTQGQIVAQGNQIGVSGHTGLATADHVHWQIRRNGILVNPLLYLKKK